MRKLYVLFWFLFSVFGFSQYITVTPSTNANDLVNNVLLANSLCVKGTNPNLSTGTNFGSTNGIGTFTNTNPAFPMTSGVILSTGNVSSAPGPNSTTLDEGSTTWQGDPDLATLIGGGATFLNASVLEFDFTPTNPQFSFDFIFASEEYGSYQCNVFPDAFAFLLTNTSTGITTNLAVIPSTNTPISVETIRDSAFNSICASANASFFGNFYGGTNALSSPTNYNGETKLMTASAILVSGTTYHIKLVIADRLDSNSDSAVFISGTSFNVGQDVLGEDLTLASHTAICDGQTYTIQSGLNPADYTFQWSANGGPFITGGPNFVVSAAGNYKLRYLKNGSPCPPEQNEINIEYYPSIVTIAPINIYKCDTGATTYSYDIAQNTPILMAGAPVLPAATTSITYYSDANATLPIASPYTATPNTTVYVKITDTTTGCSIIKPFQLLKAPFVVLPTIPMTDITLCEDSFNSNNATIVLSTKDSEALGTQSVSIYDVSYYSSQPDAIAGTPKLSNTSYVGTNGQVIWVRIQNTTDPTICSVITSFTVHIIPVPKILDAPKDILICDYDTYILPALATGEEYWTGSHLGTLPSPGTQHFAGEVISFPVSPNPNPVKFYVYTSNGNCKAETNFKITFLDLTLIPPPTLLNCDSYTLPSTDFGHYYTTPQMGMPPQPGEHLGFITAPLTTSQTVYFYVNTYVNPPLVPAQQYCEREVAFNIVVEKKPVVAPFLNVFKCISETYTLPFFNTIPNVVTPATSTLNYYTAPNGPNGTGTIVPEGTVLAATGTTPFSKNFWVWASNGTVPCVDGSKVFRVQIGLPFYQDKASCDSYKLPNLAIGNYYTQSHAGGGTGGTLLANGTNITKSQYIYVYAVSSSGCWEEKKFKVTIYMPKIKPLAAVSKCASDNYILPALETFAPNTDVSPTQFYPTLFYNTLPDGTGSTKNVGDPITTSQTIYIVALDAVHNCKTFEPLVITIIPMPSISISHFYRECYNFPPQTVAGGGYYFGPNKTGGIVPANYTLTADTTLYAYSITNTTPPCEVFDFVVTYEVDRTVANSYSDVYSCNSYSLPSIVQAATEDNRYYKLTGGPFVLGQVQYPAGYVITTTQTVYVYNSKTSRRLCFDETDFVVNIIPAPVAYPVPTASTFCDDFDGTNDGNISLDLSATFDAQILNPIIPPSPPNPQVGPQFVVAYFANQPDAIANINAITTPTTIKNLYVRVTNTLAPTCFDVQPLTITINKKPVPTNPAKWTICTDNVTGLIIQPYTIDSGLTAPTYSFEWRKDGNSTIISTASSLPNVILEGVYELIVTNVATGCKETSSTTIIKSQTAISTFSLSENFDNSQFVTISAVGNGDYVYQLDSNPEQDSPVFTDVPYGSHLVTVRDRHGCQSGTVTVLVINYPKFFTPNGDGNNDTWNVIGLDNDLTSNIYIYDRFGKYIAQIKPSEKKGWDGTYNGNPLPSSDYWFSVTYTEKGEDKIFKAHFTMKR